MIKEPFIKHNKNIKSELNHFYQFTELNPSPILELSFNGEIIYLNLAARAQFPNIHLTGDKHDILKGILSKIKTMLATYSKQLDVIMFVQEIQYGMLWYEQQIFTIPEHQSIFIYMNDITARIQIEDELKRFNKELEQRVMERTTDLKNSNIELMQAKENAMQLAEEANRANRAKTKFLTTMSHEFLTPLNGIMGMISLLQNSSLNAEQREFAETIRESSEILLALINHILDYSKIESEDATIKNISFDLNELIDKVIVNTTELLKDKTITLSTFVDKQIPITLNGDAEKIQQVLNNLLNNAVKFTEKGYINMEVRLLSREINTIVISFAIIDTGIGISKEMQKKIFKRFTQADSTITRKYGGTGLGLAICKRLTDLMHGSLYLESKIGLGSKFFFRVPLTVIRK